MKGRRMLLTTVIGAVMAVLFRRMSRRTPKRLFNGMPKNNLLGKMIQPMLRQFIRRMAR